MEFSKMSPLEYGVEQLNWSKGPTALETMTCSLYNYTRGTWKKYIREWSDDEKKRIPTFIEHVKDNKIYKDKIKKCVWNCKCGDNLCQSLLSRLVEKHQNQGSRKLVWKMDNSTTDYKSPEEYYWEFAKMFMLYGKEETKEICTMPEDTDLTLILKMMKNCKLFELNDNALCDEVLGVRNSLMHSSHYKITFNKLKDCVDAMKSFLVAINEKDDVDPEYKLEIENALRKLDVLLYEKIRIEMTIDELELIINALECQEEAIQRDMQFNGTTSQAPEELNERLLSSKRQVKNYTIIINVYRPALNIPDPTARKEAIEAIEKKHKDEERERQMKQEQLRFETEARKKQEEENRIREEVDRRIREFERKQEEERRRRAEDERNRREEEERKRKQKDKSESENMVGAGVGAFTAGAAAGAAFGPVGAVIGGTLGAFFGAKSK